MAPVLLSLFTPPLINDLDTKPVKAKRLICLLQIVQRLDDTVTTQYPGMSEIERQAFNRAPDGVLISMVWQAGLDCYYMRCHSVEYLEQQTGASHAVCWLKIIILKASVDTTQTADLNTQKSVASLDLSTSI